MLPHLLMSDIVRCMVDQRIEQPAMVVSILSWWSRGMKSVDAETRNVIGATGVEVIPNPGQPGAELRDLLAPNLRAIDLWTRPAASATHHGIIVGNVCAGLAELHDRVLQEEVWTGRRPGVMSSYSECIETLFTDSGLATALDKPGELFGEPIDAELRALDNLTRRLSKAEDVNPYDNPLLDECRRRARRALELMRAAGRCSAP